MYGLILAARLRDKTRKFTKYNKQKLIEHIESNPFDSVSEIAIKFNRHPIWLRNKIYELGYYRGWIKFK